MPITYRADKGSPLTAAEYDATILELVNRIAAVFSEDISLAGVVTAELSASVDNYAPTGIGTASVLRISATADDFNIKGIAGGAEGRILVIMNVDTTNYFYLEHQAGTSAAENRIIVEAGSWATLFPGSMTVLVYDATASRWRCMKGPMPANTAAMEGATANSVFASPLVFHKHPAAAKCWGSTTGGGTPALAVSYNVTGIADTDVGRLTVTIATDFSSANYAAIASATNATNANRMVAAVSKAAGTVILESSSAATTLADPGVGYDWVFLGDQ